MPTMVLSWSLYIPAVCGCNALVRDDAQAITDVPHSGTQHVQRFSVRKWHGKHQPRCSTEKNAPQSAACHTMSTHKMDARQGPRRAPRRAAPRRAARRRLHRSAVPAATATAPLLAPS